MVSGDLNPGLSEAKPASLLRVLAPTPVPARPLLPLRLELAPGNHIRPRDPETTPGPPRAPSMAAHSPWERGPREGPASADGSDSGFTPSPCRPHSMGTPSPGSRSLAQDKRGSGTGCIRSESGPAAWTVRVCSGGKRPRVQPGARGLPCAALRPLAAPASREGQARRACSPSRPWVCTCAFLRSKASTWGSVLRCGGPSAARCFGHRMAPRSEEPLT